MKPTEKPSSKIDMLRKENKSLLEMIEANKIQLKQWLQNTKNERLKFIDELVNLLQSLKTQKNSVSIAINFLRKLKLDPNSAGSMRKAEIDKYKVTQTTKMEFEKATDNIFWSKQSNDNINNNCCPRCITKPSGSEISGGEEDFLKSKISALEDHVKELKSTNCSLNAKYGIITSENELLKSGNIKLQLEKAEISSWKESLLKYFKDRQHQQDATNQIMKMKDSSRSVLESNCKISNILETNLGITSPIRYSNRQESEVIKKWGNVNDGTEGDMVPTFIRCLLADSLLEPEVHKTPQKLYSVAEKNSSGGKVTRKLDFYQRKNHKKNATSYSMYKKNAVNKKESNKSVIRNSQNGKSVKSSTIIHEESGSLSGSMMVDDGPIQKNNIPKMVIVNDMMDKSHSKGPMHLVFDLM